MSHSLMERLSLFCFGSALGIALGVSLLLAGCVAWITGIGVPLIHTVSSLFRGYGPAPFAAVVGGVWGAATGFTFGAALAWIYNRLASGAARPVGVSEPILSEKGIR
ncbi:MAG: hypothetical protein ACE5ID_11190 [Acidobacteriota bacterium]